MTSTHSRLSSLVSNKIDSFQEYNDYSVMVGLAPSTGARSPMLWNSLLANSSRMICLDIPDSRDLSTVFSILQEDRRCLGGSVTAPYKGDFFNLCSEVTAISKSTGVCNNFFRSDVNGLFIADNTDSTGFKEALTSKVSHAHFDCVVILGSGGVAKAVAAAVRDLFPKHIPRYILSRRSNSSSLSGILPITYSWFLNTFKFHASSKVLLINCTSVGDYSNLENDPLVSIPYIREILDLLAVSYCFDCIHTPSPPRLASFYHPYSQDGMEMNLLQAAIAFRNVYPSYEPSDVLKHLRHFSAQSIGVLR